MASTALIGGLVAISTTAPSQAFAQEATLEAPQQTSQQEDLPSDLAEIVVTAQKRRESVREVPKTVEVIGQETLTNAGVTNLQDLSRISPSIQGNNNAGSPPAIRGVSSFGYSIGVQAQTGLVLDDVPQPNFSTLADELSDVERVEVLPGPQSTLSGRNAAGGLINITTRNPSSSLGGSMTAEATDDQQRRVAGYVTGPITEQIGFSLSGYANTWEGPFKNVATGDGADGYERYGVRGKLRFTPTDSFSATLTAYYTQSKTELTGLVGGFGYVSLSDTAALFFTPGTPLVDLLGYEPQPYGDKVSSDYMGQTKSHNYGGVLKLEYDTSIGTFTSITNVSKSVQETDTPLFAFDVLPELNVQQDYNTDYTTQEVRLTSPTTSDRLTYVLGAIYSDTEIFEPYARPVVGPVDWDRTSIVQSAAAYGRVTYEVLDGTFLTGGLRYQNDTLKYDWVFADGSAPRSSGTDKYDFISGEASIRQVFTPNITGYLTYANSETGRAFDLEDSQSASSPAGLAPLDSQTVENVEAGFKTQWFGNRLTANLSAFNADYGNYQIQQSFQASPTSLPSIRLFAVGGVRTRGVEFSGGYAATSDLQLTAAATLLDAEITDYPDAPCYTGQTLPSCTGAFPTQGNLAGKSMPGAARFKALLAANYTIRLPELPFDATVNALWRYQSETHTSVLDDPISYIDAFSIVNLGVGVQSRDERYSLQFFVNNLFDENYYMGRMRAALLTDPAGSTEPALTATYARDSRRYFGVRLKLQY